MGLGESTPDAHAVVGREKEARRLEQAIATAAGGAGSVVLISGETGIGKSRLARHALELASIRGFEAVRGVSNPLTRDLAYGPIVEGISRFVAERAEPDRLHLTAGLNALGQLIAGLGLPAVTALGDTALEKTRLFESVLRLLDRASRRAPILVLLDDLHWFDRSSMELLSYLTKDLPDLPLVLIAAYRTDEGEEERGALHSLLQIFRRLPRVHEIRLSPLSERQMKALVSSVLDGPIPAPVVDWVAHRSAGVPLFAEALLRALIDRGSLQYQAASWRLVGPLQTPTPPLVRDAILQRIDRLEEQARHLIELVAVGGDDVPGAVLEEAADYPNILQAGPQLLGTGLLEERVTGEVCIGFAHPLTLQVAYEEIPPDRRRRLHGRFTTLWERNAPDDVERLAFHYREALPDADPGRAVDVLTSAGETALDRYAAAEALEHLQAAARLVSHRPELTDRVLVLLGEAKYRTGDIRGAVEIWDGAALAGDGSPTQIGRLHTMAARALSELDYVAAGRRVEAGLAALAGHEPSDDLIELLFIGAVNAHRQGNLASAAEHVMRIAEAADQVGSRRAQAVLVAAQVMVQLDRADYSAAQRTLEAQGSLLASAGPLFELRGHGWRGVIAAAWGDLRALSEAKQRAADLLRGIGMPSGEIRLQVSSFLEAFYSGDWEKAREVTLDTRLLAETLDHVQVLFLCGLLEAMLHTFQGDFERAEQRLMQSRSLVRDERVSHPPMHDLLTTTSALLALEKGDAARALTEVGTSSFVAGPLPPWTLVVRGEAEAKGGRPNRAFQTAKTVGRLGPAGSYPDAMSARLAGLAEEALGNRDEAVDRLEHAFATFRALDLPFEMARSGIELAEVASGGNDSALDEVVGEALDIFTRLGAESYAERTRGMMRSSGTPLPAATGGPELTPRQLEVAELVAGGLSNAEIADRLFISVRTVHSHLDHIYVRLGIGSRAALATWVTRRHRPVPT